MAETYDIQVTQSEWNQLQSLMAQQGVTEFTELKGNSAETLLGGDRWKVKEAALAAKCGCHIIFNPPLQGRHLGRTQPRRPKPMPPLKKP
jgi:hypothetical protein